MPGPNSTDAGFERTFADLAYARLRDKAPSMLDYLIGFQLVDKNEEETHAIGVFGFKVGAEWVYAPVFFINGELKGHELMYIKSQDAFVPMVEQWVNYILNRRPPVLGERETTPRHRLAIRGPDFDVFAQSPHIGSKHAQADTHLFSNILSRMNENFLPFMHVFTVSPSSGEKFAGLSDRLHIPNVLKGIGEKAAFVLINSMKSDTKFANAVLKYYDLKDLIDFESAKGPFPAKVAAYKPLDNNPLAPKLASEASGEKDDGKKMKDGLDTPGRDMRENKERTYPKVVVVTRGDDPSNIMQDMTEEEKKKLMRDSYVVRDQRKDSEKSVIYKSQFGQQLITPTETGLYDIILPAGDRKQLLIVVGPKQIGHSYGGAGLKALAIDPKEKTFGSYKPLDILVCKRYELGEYQKLYEGLPDADSVAVGDLAVLIGPNKTATTTFEVRQKNIGTDGRIELDVSSRCMHGKGGGGAQIMAGRSGYDYGHSTNDIWHENIRKIVLTGKDGNNLTTMGETMFVPNSFKAIKRKIPEKWEDQEKMELDVGNMSDMILKLFKSASDNNGGLQSVQIHTDGIKFFVSVGGQQSPAMSKLATIKTLIVGLGLDQEDADEVIKTAAPRKADTYFLKRAYGIQPIQGYFPEPTPHTDPTIGVPIRYDQRWTQNLGQTDNSYSRSFYQDDRRIDDAAKEFASRASNQGQKEVLDTAVITGLVKTMDSDSAVDSYIGDMLLGLDRVGRILFMYYWHNEKFKERYGQQDMIELEDNLRNVFKNLGELSLFLKQKTIEPDQANTSDVQLTDVVG